MELTSSRKRQKDNKHMDKIFELDESDTSQLLIIFPREIWRLVLSHVCTASDYHKFGQVCILFQNVLHSLRKSALIGDVWKILLQWDKTNRTPDDIWWINLRQVCRSWKKGIDHSLQNLDGHYLSINHPKNNQANLSLSKMVAHLTTEFGFAWKDIELFDCHFHLTHGLTGQNPFVLAKICMLVPFGLQNRGLADYHRNCVELVQKYGKHVWFLSLKSSAEQICDHVEFYHKILELLQFLPNLRTLELDISHPLSVRSRDPLPKSVNLYNLVNTDQLPPFLELPCLRYVEQSDLHLPLFLKIVEPNLSHLENLGMTLQSIDDFDTFKDNDLHFRVAKLNINMQQVRVLWEEVFTVLNEKFGETLTELQIWLPVPPLRTLRHRLHLPNLKILNVKFKSAEPLDFILGLTESLEELTVSVINVDEIITLANLTSEIKFYETFKNPSASNIWKKLYKLKLVVCKTDQNLYSGTRSEWKKSESNLKM